MLTTLGTSIKTRLQGLDLFKVVEEGFSKNALQSPPSAVFFLFDDVGVTDKPSPTRRLTYEIALMVSYVDPVKGQAAMNGIIDAVRPAFTKWLPVSPGCLPVSCPKIRYEGIENTLLIYSARITMDVFPETINAQENQ
jgi:hypothetical protein